MENVQSEIEEKLQTLFDSYINEFRGKYTSLNRGEKIQLIANLERFLTSGHIIEKSEVENIDFDYKDTPFSGEKAQEIRENLRLSKTELARKCGTYSTNIDCFERGTFPRSRITPSFRSYVLWLKENGYNPFNI